MKKFPFIKPSRMNIITPEPAPTQCGGRNKGSKTSECFMQGDKIMNKSNKTLVPEAKAALEKFKMEAASEVGVNLNQSYNGDITARQAGSVGGQMVKKI